MSKHDGRYGPPQHLFRYLTSCLEKTTDKWGAHRTSLFLHWHDIVGAEFSSICEPATVDRSKLGTTLTVKAEAQDAMELTYTGKDLIGRINGYFGQSLVQRLRVLHQHTGVLARKSAPRSHPEASSEEISKISTELSDIENGELRHALARLHVSAKRYR